MPEPSLFKLWSQAVVRKAASLMFPRENISFSGFFLGPNRSTYNYAADVQDGLASSVVMPCVQWLMRSFPEAPLVVRKQQGDELEVVAAHPMVQLVNRPNAFYSGVILWMATVTDWTWFGESYWRILRSRGGQPAELWWIPPWSIKPKWPDDGSVYISHYDYQPSIGEPIRLEMDEVIHFRHGLDPRNMRHGLPPLRAILQDIWIDAESSNFVGAILRNMGVPGLIISPKGDEHLSPADVEQVKAYIQSRFTGDQRGMPLALGGPTDVHKIAQSPADLDMSNIRSTAEERVSAALGIPAAVIGFGTGLSNSKVGATMAEFVRLAWSNGIVPMQRLMAAELQRTLLPLFETSADTFQVGWDYDEVSSLQEDQNALAKRYEGLWEKGLLKKSECRQALGYESDPEDDIYFHPNSGTAVDPKDQMPKPEPLPMPAALPAAQGANGNGNGNGAVRVTRAVGEPVAHLTGRIGFVQETPVVSRLMLGRVVPEQLDTDDEPAAESKQGTLEEFLNQIIGQHADRLAVIPPHLLRLVARQWRRERALAPRFEREIAEVLRRYGDRAALAAREVLAPKQSLQDLLSTSVILERLPMAQVRAELEAVYTRMYEEMFGLTQELLDAALPLPPTRPSLVTAHLSQFARERVALLDLPGEARTGILRSIEEARVQGLTEDDMIALIRNRVPAGRWRSVESRAQVIVRTESRYGSNLATASYAQQLGAKVLVVDARLGPTDEACTARNGWIVTPGEARQLAGVEHTNGTLSFLPLAEGILSPQGVAQAEPQPVTLDAVMAAGKRLDTSWQKEMGPQYAPLVSRMQRLEAETDRLKIAHQNTRDISAQNTLRTQYNQSLQELQNTKNELARLQRPALEKVLREVRPLGEVEARWTADTADTVKSSIADVSKSYPRSWLQHSVDKGVMRGSVSDRGSYVISREPHLRLSGEGGKYVRAAFHEFGHRFEHVVPDLLKMEREFYARRTAAPLPENRLKWLGTGYKKTETARFDKFVKPYMGKDYGGQSYELFSMGAESVFTGSYDLSPDPEFRQFILGLLAVV